MVDPALPENWKILHEMRHFVAIFRIIQLPVDDMFMTNECFPAATTIRTPVHSPMSKISLARRSAPIFVLFGALLLAACSPKYNWREVRGKNAPFVVLLPDKPVTVTRNINVGGVPATMTMTAAEVDGVNFAVGYVVLADEKQSLAAANAMKAALLNNIDGTLKVDPAQDSQEKSATGPSRTDDIEAEGRRPGSGEPLLLLGHFEAKGNFAYQVIVLGNKKTVSREEANTFLASFKLN